MCVLQGFSGVSARWSPETHGHSQTLETCMWKTCSTIIFTQNHYFGRVFFFFPKCVWYEMKSILVEDRESIPLFRHPRLGEWLPAFEKYYICHGFLWFRAVFSGTCFKKILLPFFVRRDPQGIVTNYHRYVTTVIIYSILFFIILFFIFIITLVLSSFIPVPFVSF